MKLKLIAISLLFLLPSVAYAVSTDTCYDTDAGLMLHLDNNFIDDISMGKTVTGTNTAFSTTKKFGTHSVYHNGSNAYFKVGDSDDWNFSTGDFTIDFQIRRVGNAESTTFELGSSTDGVRLWHTGANYYLYINGTLVISDAVAVAADGNFHHIAITRSGTSVKVFKDGTQTGSTGTNSANITAGTAGVTFGARADNSGIIEESYFDEVRIVKGTAVWTADFTAPLAAYSSCGGGPSGTTTYQQSYSQGSRFMII